MLSRRDHSLAIRRRSRCNRILKIFFLQRVLRVRLYYYEKRKVNIQYRIYIISKIIVQAIHITCDYGTAILANFVVFTANMNSLNIDYTFRINPFVSYCMYILCKNCSVVLWLLLLFWFPFIRIISSLYNVL